MPLDLEPMFRVTDAATFTTASDSDTSTFSQTGAALVDPAITSPRTVTVNHNYGLVIGVPVASNPSITCPWTFSVATGKTLSLGSSDTGTQKMTFSGVITAAGTGKVFMGPVGSGNASFYALTGNSNLTDLAWANIADICVELSSGTLNSAGATMRFNSASGILRWATGNTTDYSAAAYTYVNGGSGLGLDPNGQTITLSNAFNRGACSVQVGQSLASRRVGGGRLKFNGNTTVGRAFWVVYAGTVMELNGTFTGAFAANTVGSSGGTSVTLPAGLEGTGTTEQSWAVNNTAYSYIAGGTTGTNGVLTVADLTFAGTLSELWVYSDGQVGGVSGQCSKVHANGTVALGDCNVRLRNVMQAGTYTILSSTGAMSGTAPNAASVIDLGPNAGIRTVTSLTQVANTLVLVLGNA